MHFTATTPLAAVLCIAILFLGPARGVVLLLAALPLGSAAAVNLSGLGSIFVAEAALLALFTSSLIRGVDGRDIVRLVHPAGAGLPLSALVLVCVVGAFFLPRIHLGATDVYTLVRDADGAGLALRPLQPSGSNIGQTLRLTLAAFGFFTLAWVMMRGVELRHVYQGMFAATVLHILLAILDLAAPLTSMQPLAWLRNAYVMILDDQTLFGLRRLIGGFPEPSAFGMFTVALYGFWLRIWVGHPRSATGFVLAAVLLALLIRSTSTAAYLGAGVFTLFFVISFLRKSLRERSILVPFLLLIALLPFTLASALLVYHTVPSVAVLVDVIVFEKLQSTSGAERLAWNRQALLNFIETFGMGAGVGSLRASGWPFAVLGSTGIVGAALYLWFLYALFRLLREAETDPTLPALRAACGAVLILACVTLPQPNLGLTFFLLAGTISGFQCRARQPDPRIHNGSVQGVMP